MSKMRLQAEAANIKPLTQKRRGTPTHIQGKRLLLNPHPVSPNNTLQLNQAIGNRAATRYLSQSSSVRVQPKLAVGHFDDPYEQQANQVAAGQQPANLQRVSQASGMPVSEDFAKQLGHAKSGALLPEKTRVQMEAKLGADLSGARVHTDSQAAQLNQQLQSQAFTHGPDIYFNQGHYQPGTTAGDQLLAHELTHVAQQQDGAASMLQAGGRSSEEVANQIIELCEQNDKSGLAPKLIEVVNFCLAHFEGNMEIEDDIFEYLHVVLQTDTMPEGASKRQILGELSANIPQLEGLSLSTETEELGNTDSSSDGDEPFEVWPLEARPIIKLYVEQGVAAPLGQAILFSGQFSTCSPVVMLNNSTGMGGLFHFAAKGLHKQTSSLLQLCDLVDPDTIYLFGEDSSVSVHIDQDALWKFFDKHRPDIDIEELDTSFSGLYITLSPENSLQLSKRKPKDEAVAHDLRNAQNVELPSNTSFVGKSEVADFWL